jgi:hypothetical protein
MTWQLSPPTLKGDGIKKGCNYQAVGIRALFKVAYHSMGWLSVQIRTEDSSMRGGVGGGGVGGKGGGGGRGEK